MGIAADLLKQARSEAGITMAELAARAGTSKPTISRYENGLVDPGAGTLERLLQACGYVLRATPTGLPATLDRLGERFQGQHEPTADDATRTSSGRRLRTADDLKSFAAELESQGLLAQ
jgi:transcriptional regulator with XRE-family HTH domain